MNEADPERIIIDCMAYREVLLRVAIQYLMQQNFVQLAEGEALDYWGELFAVARLQDETDSDYRGRILEATSSAGLGTKQAYSSRILTLQNVADVLIYSKNDDNTLLPGHVRVIPIKQIVDPASNIASGHVHDTALEIKILDTILTDDFGVIGNVFEFEPAVPVTISGQVNVTKKTGFSDSEIIANVDHQMSRYFGQLSLSFNAVFGLVELQDYLLNAEGLSQIVSLNFDAVPALTERQFYQRGNVTINIV